MHTNYVSFGNKKRTSQYTNHQIKIMKELKKASLKKNWIDIYTGERFSILNPPTIEHIIPCSCKNGAKVKKLKSQGFQQNGLDNIFPAGSLGNSDRGSKSFLKTVLEKPIILTRFFDELEKYKTYNTDLIQGKDWVNRLINTLINELTGICSEIKSKKLIIFK